MGRVQHAPTHLESTKVCVSRVCTSRICTSHWLGEPNVIGPRVSCTIELRCWHRLSCGRLQWRSAVPLQSQYGHQRKQGAERPSWRQVQGTACCSHSLPPVLLPSATEQGWRKACPLEAAASFSFQFQPMSRVCFYSFETNIWF